MGSGIGSGAVMAVLAVALAACGGSGGGGAPAEVDLVMPDGGDTPPQAELPPMPTMPPMPPPPDTSRLQPAQIVDRHGFGQAMVAAELQIPAGWQVVGGVGWNDATPCVGNRLQMGWSAIAPDSLTAIEKLPGFTWQVQGTEQQFNPCPSAPFRSAREFLEATALRLRPGSRVLGYEDLTQQVMQQMQAAGGQAQARWDAGRIRIAYRDQGGVDMEEVMVAAVAFTRVGDSLVGGTAVVDAHRAPAGRLEPDLVQRVGATVVFDPQWAQAMRQRQQSALSRHHEGIRASINDWHNREMAAINARGAADRHAIRMRGNQETAAIYGAIAANSSATSDRMHATTMSGIGGYDRYAGADGTEVRNSIHHGPRVFQDTSRPEQAMSTSDPYATPPSGMVELERMR